MNTRDALAIGSDTRPPVLFRGDFSQWKSRFLDFVAKQPLHKQIMESLKNGPVKYYTEIPAVPDGNPPIVGGIVEKDETNFTPEEANRVRGDILAKSYLIQSLPNEIYANIDCNDTGKAMWDEITSLMHGTEKGIQMKRTNLLTKFATFKGREGELLEDTYHRFCTMINELRKNNLKKSQLDINIQFINSLRSEWRRFASNLQQNRNLEDLDIHELFELLNHNQDEVLEILGTEKKPEKYTDPLALVVDRRQYSSGRSSRYEEDYDIPSDIGERGSESDEEMSDMKKALALITRTMAKRTSRKPLSSNNHRYSSGRSMKLGTGMNQRMMLEGMRGQLRQITGGMKILESGGMKSRGKEDMKKGGMRIPEIEDLMNQREDKGKEVKKADGGPTCFKCGKPGHFAKNCTNHVSKYDYYKNKMNLAKRQDEGHALLAEDEAWLQMSSDDEERGLVCMLAQDDAWNVDSDEGKEDQLCLMADVEEQYSEDSDKDYNDVDSDHSDSSSEVLPDPYIELENQVKSLAQKVSEYENKIKQANKRTTIVESKLASEHALVVKFSTELAHSKEKVTTLTLANKTLEDKVASLNDNISDLQKKLHEAEVLSRESLQKYEVIFAQRTNLFAKIKDMEDKFLKRGQTDQTIHMNQPKEFNYYNPKEGIGYKSPCYLKRAISKTPTLYDLRYMSLGYKIIFMKESDDPEQLKEIEKKEKARKNKHSIPFNYSSLNASYATREIPLSKDYTPSYTEAEMNQEVPILEKVYNDNKTFFEKRIATLEAELEDERRMSLREKDLFLSRINELETALKSKSTPKASQSTFGTCDNSHHHHHTLNVDAPDFRPSNTYTQNSQSIVLRSPICTTISYMGYLSTTTPKSTVQISEIVSDDCTNGAGENGRSPGTSKPGNVTPIKPTRKDKGKEKVITPESEVASSSRTNESVPKKNNRFQKPKNSSKPKGHSHNFHPKNTTSPSNSQNDKNKNHTSRNVRDDHLRNGRHRAKENGTKEGGRPKPFAHKTRNMKNRFFNDGFHRTYSHVPHTLFNFHDCEHVAYGYRSDFRCRNCFHFGFCANAFVNDCYAHNYYGFYNHAYHHHTYHAKKHNSKPKKKTPKKSKEESEPAGTNPKGPIHKWTTDFIQKSNPGASSSMVEIPPETRFRVYQIQIPDPSLSPLPASPEPETGTPEVSSRRVSEGIKRGHSPGGGDQGLEHEELGGYDGGRLGGDDDRSGACTLHVHDSHQSLSLFPLVYFDDSGDDHPSEGEDDIRFEGDLTVEERRSRAATSATRTHVLSTGIEVDTSHLEVQLHAPLSHSLTSQQVRVSFHGDLAQRLSRPHLEGSGIETGGSLPRSPTFLDEHMSLEPNDTLLGTHTASLSDAAHTVDSAVVQTGTLCEPGVTYPASVVRDIVDSALKAVREEFAGRIAVLEAQLKGKGQVVEPVRDPSPPPPPTSPPRSTAPASSSDELRDLLMTSLLSRSDLNDNEVTLLGYLKRFTDTSLPVSHPEPATSSSQEVVSSIQRLEGKLDAMKTEVQFDISLVKGSLSGVQTQIRDLQTTCRAAAKPARRRHDDRDDPDRREGEITKRARHISLALTGTSSGTAPSGTRTDTGADVQHSQPSQRTVVDVEMGCQTSSSLSFGSPPPYMSPLPLTPSPTCHDHDRPPPRTPSPVPSVSPPRASPTVPDFSAFGTPSPPPRSTVRCRAPINPVTHGPQRPIHGQWRQPSVSPPKVIYPNEKGALSNRRRYVEPRVPIRWDRERRRGRYLEDSHRSIFTDEVLDLPIEKYLGITKMPKSDQVKHVHWMKSQAKPQRDVFFYNNPIFLIRKISSVCFQGLWFSVFIIVRKNTRVYTFSEADFENVHIDDIETLFTDLKTLTSRPQAFYEGLEAVKRFIVRNRRNSEISDFQIGLESHQNTINLTSPNQDLPNIDRYPLFDVIEKPSLGVVYPNEKGEKKFMRCDEVHKYCDGTLHFINKGLATEEKRRELEVQKTGHWMDPTMLIKKAFRIIAHRLEHRNVLRRLESFYGLRKIEGPAKKLEERPPPPRRDEGSSRKTTYPRRKTLSNHQRRRRN
ncbi:hypothetical protein OSB04_017593 [Centaurea solstitialis]|uniref:CCHC-type domain-containing protein n=1 Tax=Centaurea solstitialis TaxID=347529 RepID=A0AA38TAQ7_9ASTR|nr:hypothetical protein OSB04_017593 [Centaurea solstitialis]